MNRILMAIVAIYIPIVATAENITGKAAITLLSKGVIINETNFREMKPIMGDYKKLFSVIYQGDVFLCEVEQNNLIINALCVSTVYQ